jgi:hypothetical protein
MVKLKKFRKGIVLLQGLQHATAKARADLVAELKINSFQYCIYEAEVSGKNIALLKHVKNAGGESRPTLSVLRTITE